MLSDAQIAEVDNGTNVTCIYESKFGPAGKPWAETHTDPSGVTFHESEAAAIAYARSQGCTLRYNDEEQIVPL